MDAKHRSECFRKLTEKFASSREGINHRHRKNFKQVYPEPLLVVRIR